MPVLFECQRCGACCRWRGEVRLTDGEVVRLAQYQGLSEAEFIAGYTRLAYCRAGVALLEKPDGECIFLEGCNCTVQSVKPQQCRNFPNAWRFPGFELVCGAAPRQVSPEEWERLVEATTGQKLPAAVPAGGEKHLTLLPISE